MYLVLILLFILVISLRVQGFLKPNRLGTRSFTTRILAASKIKMVKDQSQKKRQQFGLGKIAFSLVPLTPESVGRRKTIFSEIVPNKIWTLDQIQGVIMVNVPVRCTVIKLKDGGLFINNPVAPTDECIEMIRSLEAAHGPVKFITLSSIALEHKGTTGAFSRFFPKAYIYVQPGQYSFPINLPTQLFFPFGKTIKEIPENSADAPWGDEIDHAILGPLRPKGVGGFAETAFFHRDTQTLLVTDTVVRVDDEPPAIIQEDPRALIYHSRENMLQVVKDTPENRRKGWRRMVLFGLTFQPSGINVTDTLNAVKMLKDVTPEMKKLGEGAIPIDGGLYPWEWVKDEKPNFKALQGGLLVAPILQKLILNRNPDVVISWVDKVCKWPFKRIIPCHLSNDLKATPKDFRKAFNFLYESEKSVKPNDPISSLVSFIFPNSNTGRSCPRGLEEDTKFLSDVSKSLTEQNVLFPEAPLLKS